MKKPVSKIRKPTAVINKTTKTTAQVVTNNVHSWQWWVVSILVIVLSLFAYSSAFDNGITNWDDDYYINQNPYLQFSASNVAKLFAFDTYYMGNYHPLAMVSLSIDNSLGGGKAFAFIFSNVLFHTIASVLVLFFVYRLLLLSYPQRFKQNFAMAAISGLLFAVHTIHVESVAWISERKDVLYTLFFVASLLCYVVYVQKKSWVWYGAALLLFILSLFSKGQAVTLSVTLLAIDFFARRNLLSIKVLSEKIPFFALSLLFGILAIKAQHAGEAIHDITEYPFHERIMYAGYAFCQYIFKLVYPYGLSAVYPYPYTPGQMPSYYFTFVLIPVALILLFLFLAERNRLVAFGVAFFVINVVLLLQFLPVGSAIMADRYVYVSSIGFFMLVAESGRYAMQRFNIGTSTLFSIFGVYLLLLTVLTYQRCSVWKDNMSLWNDVLEKQPKAVVGWNNRGSEKTRQKDLKGAIADFDEAIGRKPDYTHAYYNRGTAKKDLKDFKGAVADFDHALEVDSNFKQGHYNKGVTYDQWGDETGGDTLKYLLAYQCYTRAIDLDSTYLDAYINRGAICGKLKRFDLAINDFNNVLNIQPDNTSAYSNRGYAKRLTGDLTGAIDDYTKAIEIDPDFLTPYYNRALVYFDQKKYNEALADFNKVLQINPEHAEAKMYQQAVTKILGQNI